MRPQVPLLRLPPAALAFFSLFSACTGPTGSTARDLLVSELGDGSAQHDDAMTQSWYVSSTGAFLRLWKNQHPYDLCRHQTDELTYAGKAGGPMEITCTCDADLCMVTGVSKTTPPGKHGSMPEVSSTRYSLVGSEVVILAD